MATTTKITNINEFVLDFLSKVGLEYDSEISAGFLEAWSSTENQEELATILPKTVTKVVTKVVTKKLKDPNKPKRPRSSYIFFCSAKRSEVKAKMGDDAKATDVTSALGEAWGKLKEDDLVQLAIYTKLAEDDKVRFDKEMESYESPSDSELESTEKKRKSSGKKNKDAPKRPKSSYLFFCMEERAKIKEEMGEDAKATEVTAALGVAWGELKESKKKADVSKMEKLTKMAEDDKTRYLAEMSLAAEKEGSNTEESSLSNEDVVEEYAAPVKPKTVKGTTKGVKDENVPKKKNGYTTFCQENRESVKTENPELNGTDITKKLSQMWKALSEEKRAEWKE